MFSNFANKLQSTISNTLHPDGDAGPDGQPAQTSSRTHAIDQLTNSLRSLHAQYSPNVPPSLRPLQLVITTEKSLALSYESVAQNARSHSRDLFLWGQDQQEDDLADVRDVSDRLAFLSFSHGVLASQLGQALSNDARAPFKQLREAEQLLAPRKAARTAAQAALQRARSPQERHEIEEALAKGAAEDIELETRAKRARRECLREAERAKWAAIRTYADKLLLLARAAEPLLELIPPVPSVTPGVVDTSLAKPPVYDGAQTTADVKSAVQHALDTYVAGQPLEPLPPVPRDGQGLSRAASDRRGFGETHLHEIDSNVEPPPTGTLAPPPSAIGPGPGHRFVAPPHPSAGVGAAASPPSSYYPTSPLAKTTSHSDLPPTSSFGATSPPTLTANLNQTPAPLPPPITTATMAASPPTITPHEPTSTTSGTVPTIAETGVPVAASAEGPGPQSGSLRKDDLRPPPPGSWGSRYEGAEEEKRRLEREARDSYLSGSGGSAAYAPPPAGTAGGMTESERQAKEEKQRLEREERERFLRGQGSGQGGQGDDDLPPYAG